MLTPVDVQNKVFKGGIGYDKRDVEMFIREVAADYEQLYRSNVELNDKVATLNESLQHYRATEDSMQKALTISEKTAEETINAANDKARQTISIAEKQAEDILADTKEELANTKDEIFRLQKLHAKFKTQYKKILEGQLKLIDGAVEDIDLGEGYDIGSFDFSSSGMPREGGLGGLGEGGGYTGSSFDNRFERTNQDPTINRTSLNMDPFTDAANGGGRFSRQTGKGFVSNDSKKSTKAENKGGLNMKNSKTVKKNSRVKKDFTSPDTVAAAKAAAEAAYAKSIDAEKEKKAAKISRNTKSTTDNSKETVSPEPTTVTPEPVNVAPEPVNVAPETSTVTHTPETSATFTETATVSSETTSNVSYTDSAEQTTSTASESVTETASSYYSDTVNNYESSDVDVETGEVESKIDESALIGNDDDNDEGFSFMNDDVWVSESENNTSSDDYSDSDAVAGEVEDKISESTLLGNDDNHDEGFDFVEEATEEEMSAYYEEKNIVSGEVEDRNVESTMLDSEDNYNEGFDFVVGEESSPEDDIPTISSILGGSSFDTASDSSSSEDVLEGAVEDSINRTNMIENEDNHDEGFSFL